jgi:hypothetical protein
MNNVERICYLASALADERKAFPSPVPMLKPACRSIASAHGGNLEGINPATGEPIPVIRGLIGGDDFTYTEWQPSSAVSHKRRELYAVGRTLEFRSLTAEECDMLVQFYKSGLGVPLDLPFKQ